ncbi:MAG: glucan 1,4-alpha-glucosidase, partial [Deltaproteobacteria bacterium]|nr:glucan 1,4-alpha-glucosidase [Deltaproteobacteria bacterium]
DEYWPMIESAAHLIATSGPWSEQERWEENYGISPSTVAAEIAALICASDLALAKGAQEASQFWAQTADHWSLTSGDNVEAWTFTTSGMWGNGKYYLRLDGASRFSPFEPDYLARWDPNDTKKIALANASGIYLEKEIIDGGFLELVRYGVRSATNEFILDSLSELDEKIKVTTPLGPAWYRYLYDGYGEEGRGRLWTLLTAERAQYELALLLKRKANPKVISSTLDQYIRTLEAFANEGLLFPEQVWDQGPMIGEGTGSATPLLWTHAEYIKLLRSKADQSPFDLIPIVYSRYKDY